MVLQRLLGRLFEVFFHRGEVMVFPALLVILALAGRNVGVTKGYFGPSFHGFEQNLELGIGT